MKRHIIFSIILAAFLTLIPWPTQRIHSEAQAYKVIGSRTMGMTNRHPQPYANEVYRDNILLTIAYMTGREAHGGAVDWDTVRRPGTYRWTLPSGQTFAYHDSVLPEFSGRLAGTTNAHFGGHEGFKSDGFLMGNGVCHLASLIAWAAKDARLEVVAPTDHDFAPIPDVPQEYGVAIYSMPGQPSVGGPQNLYVTNNKGHDITLEFTYDGAALTVSVVAPS